VKHLLVVNEEGELVRTRLMVVVLANNDEASSPVLRLINTIERIY